MQAGCTLAWAQPKGRKSACNGRTANRAIPTVSSPTNSSSWIARKNRRPIGIPGDENLRPGAIGGACQCGHAWRQIVLEEPNAALARAIAARVTGCAPLAVRRFANGLQHYVFDVDFTDHPSIVVRIGSRSAQSLMAGALHLSELLRPLGAPLPAILGRDIEAEFPWLVL